MTFDASVVSVVVPNLHSPLLGEVVAALRHQTLPPCEVIVVGQDRWGLVHDDALVHCINTPHPVSAACARNLGAAAARGTHLLFIDADCIAAPDLVERMAAVHQKGLRVVGGGVRFEADSYWTVCDNLLSFAPFLVHMPRGPRPYVPSLNLSIERALFDQVGGFNEGFAGAAGEDTELSLRLRTHDVTLWFEPQAVVTHRPQRGTSRAVWRHLRAFGRVHLPIYQCYPLLSRSRLPQLNRRLLPLLVALTPWLALADALRLIATNRVARRFPWALPGLAWGKCAWYVGVIEALAAQAHAEQ